MEQNSVIEIGSRANVIIKFKAQTNINGRCYAANEPYLYLKDVSVDIIYDNNNKTADVNPKTYLANSNINPSIISIKNIAFSRKLAALLSDYESTGTPYNYTVFKSLAAEDGEIYLTEILDSTKSFYVYDSNFVQLTPTPTYISASNSIQSGSFVNGQTYLISYSSVEQGTKFNLIKPSFPYMSLEIQGVGNIEKITKNVLVYFDKVSLASVLNLKFIQDSSINAPLDFIVLDGQNYIIFED